MEAEVDQRKLVRDERARGYWWVELLVAGLVILAVAAVVVGGVLASEPDRSWAWLAAGVGQGVACLTVAGVLTLLRDIARAA